MHLSPSSSVSSLFDSPSLSRLTTVLPASRPTGPLPQPPTASSTPSNVPNKLLTSLNLSSTPSYPPIPPTPHSAPAYQSCSRTQRHIYSRAHQALVSPESNGFPHNSRLTSTLPYSPTPTVSAISLNRFQASIPPSRYLLTVIPPQSLPHDPPHPRTGPACTGYGPPHTFRRGTLIPLYPTLSSQLSAIAREYGLPSTGGMVLYLIEGSIHTGKIADQIAGGPRIGEEAWQLLWANLFEEEAEIEREKQEDLLLQRFNKQGGRGRKSTTRSAYQGMTYDEGVQEEIVHGHQQTAEESSDPGTEVDPVYLPTRRTTSRSDATNNTPISSTTQHPRSAASHSSLADSLASLAFPPIISRDTSSSAGSYRSFPRRSTTSFSSSRVRSSLGPGVGTSVVAGKIEFEIDTRRGAGRWFGHWIETATVMAGEGLPLVLAGQLESGKALGQAPRERDRETTIKRQRIPITTRDDHKKNGDNNSNESCDESNCENGYEALPEPASEEEEGDAQQLTLSVFQGDGQVAEGVYLDPLAGVFPSDDKTWTDHTRTTGDSAGALELSRDLDKVEEKDRETDVEEVIEMILDRRLPSSIPSSSLSPPIQLEPVISSITISPLTSSSVTLATLTPPSVTLSPSPLSLPQPRPSPTIAQIISNPTTDLNPSPRTHLNSNPYSDSCRNSTAEMKAELDELERTLAELSPRALKTSVSRYNGPTEAMLEKLKNRKVTTTPTTTTTTSVGSEIKEEQDRFPKVNRSSLGLRTKKTSNAVGNSSTAPASKFFSPSSWTIMGNSYSAKKLEEIEGGGWDPEDRDQEVRSSIWSRRRRRRRWRSAEEAADRDETEGRASRNGDPEMTLGGGGGKLPALRKARISITTKLKGDLSVREESRKERR